ncbi:MAG: SCP-2 sterol transfer family protein [Gammaproteobacteria bacterium]|nr:SCP-2 sterol transfer family protein [Gammaproteobacteria bacterium]
MADIFAEQWMQKLVDEWNKEPELANELSNIGFNSTIAYGFENEDEPRAVLVIKKGKAVSGDVFSQQEFNWDLRAAKEDWKKWFKKPPGMMALGMAYTSRKLRFKKGDYVAMIKDPRMAGPFLKSFTVMGRV